MPRKTVKKNQPDDTPKLLSDEERIDLIANLLLDFLDERVGNDEPGV